MCYTATLRIPLEQLHPVTSSPAVKSYPIDSLAVAFKFNLVYAVVGMGAITQEHAPHDHRCTGIHVNSASLGA